MGIQTIAFSSQSVTPLDNSLQFDDFFLQFDSIAFELLSFRFQHIFGCMQIALECMQFPVLRVEQFFQSRNFLLGPLNALHVQRRHGRRHLSAAGFRNR